MLREITDKMAPPRALFVDFPLGYPLGAPNDAPLQCQIIRSAFEMLSQDVANPLVTELV